MPNTATLNLIVELKDEASKGMDKISKEAKEMDKATQGAAKSTGGLGAGLMGMVNPAGLALAGVGLLTTGLFKSVEAAKEEAVGIARLDQALKNSIPGFDAATSGVDDYIASKEKLSFADDEIRDSLGHLVMQTGNLAEAQNLQAMAMDLARAKGIDLATATKAVGKVDQESLGILKKLGIQVEENMTKEQALAAIRTATSGQAEAYANTAAGAQERLGNIMGNVMEDIGGVVLPLFTNALQGAILAFEFLGTAASNVMGVLQSWGQTIMTFLQPAIDGFIGAWNGFMAIIGPQIANLQAFFGGIVTAVQGFFTTIGGGGDIMAAFGTLFSDLGTTIGTFVTNTITWLGEALPKIAEQMGQWASAMWTWVTESAIPGLMSALQGLGEAVWGWITGGGLQGLVSNLVTWGTAILNWIAKDVLPFLGQKLLDLGTFIWNWITGGGLTSLISNLVTWGTAILNFIAKDVLPFIGQKLMDLGNFIWNWITGGGLTALIGNLVQWGGAFLNWIAKDVLPFIGAKLAELGTAIWTWITETAKGLVTKLGEWATSLWTWVTTTAGQIPTKLGEIWTAISKWVTDTAKKLLTKAKDMGKALLDGIVDGIKGLGEALWNFISGIARDIWNNLVNFFTGGAQTQNQQGPPPPPGKAVGGPVKARMPYIVGERGPELFIPGASGTIIPNNMLPSGSGGGTQTIQIILDGRVLAEVLSPRLEDRRSLRNAYSSGAV